MKPIFRAERCGVIVAALCATLLSTPTAPLRADDAASVRIAAELGVTGGLCVQLGAERTEIAAQLAASGRFLVQVLDVDRQLVDQARDRLQASELYGMVSVDLLPKEGGLPYTEDLVNLLVVSPRGSVSFSAAEASRVLCPDGVLVMAGPMAT